MIFPKLLNHHSQFLGIAFEQIGKPLGIQLRKMLPGIVLRMPCGSFLGLLQGDLGGLCRGVPSHTLLHVDINTRGFTEVCVYRTGGGNGGHHRGLGHRSWLGHLKLCVFGGRLLVSL